jgi:hypothetical protein
MSVATLGLLLFTLSACLLCGTTVLVARRVARTGSELLWLIPAFVSLQIGVLACALSFAARMTPGWWLIGQAALLAGVLLWMRRRPRPEPLHTLRSLRGWWTSASALARGAVVATVIFVALSGVRQAAEPISGFDDRMYHASRVAYWVQNASIFPYPTHNERQVAFPFGSELYFLWPVLLTKCETAGRLVFWLGFPLAALGVHLLAGRAKVREPFRSFAALLFVSTPIVGSQSTGLAPEIWLAFFQLATAFWILAAAEAEDARAVARAAGWAGLALVLALSVKTTAAGLIFPTALLPLVIVRRTTRWPALRNLAAGAMAAFLLSGLALTSAGNLVRCGNALGSAGLRQVHRSDLNVRQLYIHAVRLPLLLFEVPWIPDPLRGRLEAGGGSLAEQTGATQTIAFEDSKWPWPGRFQFTLPETARNYSLGGLLWLPGLTCAFVLVLRNFGNRGAANVRAPLGLCTLLSFSSLLPVVFGLRWMVGSAVPVRFLVAPFALGVVLLAVLAARPRAPGRTVVAFAASVLGFQCFFSLRADYAGSRAALHMPLPDSTLDEPFAGVMQDLPPGSCVLVLAHQDTRDYPLFRPREGFPNRVVAWGDDPPVAERIVARADAVGATKIVFVGSKWVMRSGRPPRPWIPTPMRVAEAVESLRADARVREVRPSVGDLRVFDVVAPR